MSNIRSTKHGMEVRTRMKEKIIEYICKHGYAPTVREIGQMVGLKSTSSVHAHLIRMFDAGMLETDDRFGSPRAIRIPEYKFVKVEGETDGSE